ncbi:hypothetical protein BJF78_32425 [Pseudonocardia sp. CNS-139]|nr:hypothetical protein BJF78_32425 [Pseudonocardia sp. CNS-139]
MLALAEVGPDDDFFALGGHSLLATRLLGRLRAAFGAEVGVRDVFEASTPAALAARLTAARGPAAPVPPLRRAARPAVLPLAPAQQRLWFLDRLEEAGGVYTIPFAGRFTGPLDADALRAALADLAARHEVLRTTFPAVDGLARQVVHDDLGPRLDVVDCGDRAAEDLVAEACGHRFVLDREPPLRAWLFREAPDRHVLLLLLHHIAADGASAGPLLRDLAAAYDARRAGRTDDRPALPVQYADYALWQHALLEDGGRAAAQLDFWRAALAGAPPELLLPADRARTPETGYAAGEVGHALPAELVAAVRETAREHGGTVFMAFQAAVAALLAHLAPARTCRWARRSRAAATTR